MEFIDVSHSGFLIAMSCLIAVTAGFTGLSLTRENRRLDREKGVLERRLKDLSTQLSQTVQDTEYSVLASEHAPHGIIVQDMLGRILWSNPAFRSIHGREHADIVGKHPLKFAVPADVMPKLTSC